MWSRRCIEIEDDVPPPTASWVFEDGPPDAIDGADEPGVHGEDIVFVCDLISFVGWPVERSTLREETVQLPLESCLFLEPLPSALVLRWKDVAVHKYLSRLTCLALPSYGPGSQYRERIHGRVSDVYVGLRREFT